MLPQNLKPVSHSIGLPNHAVRPNTTGAKMPTTVWGIASGTVLPPAPIHDLPAWKPGAGQDVPQRSPQQAGQQRGHEGGFQAQRDGGHDLRRLGGTGQAGEVVGQEHPEERNQDERQQQAAGHGKGEGQAAWGAGSRHPCQGAATRHQGFHAGRGLGLVGRVGGMHGPEPIGGHGLPALFAQHEGHEGRPESGCAALVGMVTA